jgi:hypothetical protein
MIMRFAYEIVGLAFLPSMINIVVQTIDGCSAAKTEMSVIFFHGK